MVSMGGNVLPYFVAKRKSQTIDNNILQIPQSTEGKDWFYYVDKNVTTELLEQLTDEFIAIYKRSPARLKNKLSSTIKDLTTSSTISVRIPAPAHTHTHSFYFWANLSILINICICRMMRIVQDHSTGRLVIIDLLAIIRLNNNRQCTHRVSKELYLTLDMFH